MRHTLTGVGIYEGGLRFGDPTEAADCAAEIESLGYTAAWLPDIGGDVFGAVQNLLDNTHDLTIATGILNLWMHDPADCATRYTELAKAYRHRMLIGIGTSHAQYVDHDDPGRYRRPLTKMREFLDALDAAPEPIPSENRVLAALGPKMLELSRDRSAGAHTYLVTPEHTAAARTILGSGPQLVPEQGVVLETDPERARAIARQNIAVYFGLPNYVNNWLRSGFTEEDVKAPGSNRLIDSLVAWGDEDTIGKRIREHHDAGADHVCVQVMIDRPDQTVFPRQQWRELAPVLTEIR